MIAFTPSDHSHLLEHGWVSLDMGISKADLKRYRDALLAMRARAVREAYPIGRIYWDYLGTNNLAAIEAPLNDAILDPSLVEMFGRLQLGDLTSSILNWPGSYCSLVRLFCMDGYKYRGHWHRDYPLYQPEVEKLSSLQVAVYVEDQPGFRILRKGMEFDQDESIFPDESAANDVLLTPLYVNLPEDTYIETKGRAGTVMLFNPSVMHQGSSAKRRLDFHMRFRSTNVPSEDRALVQDESLGFQMLDFLSPEFDLAKIKRDNLLPLVERSDFTRRLINTVGYYSGLRNAADFMRLRTEWKKVRRNAPVQKDYGANTLFQR